MARTGSIIKAEDLDTLIRLEAQYPVADTVYRTQDEVEWTLVEEIWAQVRDVLPSKGEQIDGSIEQARRPARIRMRWRDDIDGSMRVVVDGRVMQIISGPAMMGRREGTEIIAEEYSTPGSPVEVEG